MRVGKRPYDRIKISRYLILGAGRKKTESIVAGTQIIEFKGVASPGDAQDDLMNCLQNLMRTDEVALAEGFLGAGAYVFADGPLNYFSAAADPLVGVIKRIHLPYLDAPHFALVARLERGERTPLFSIRDGKYNRYSWFQRLATPRVLERRLAGSSAWKCARPLACSRQPSLLTSQRHACPSLHQPPSAIRGRRRTWCRWVRLSVRHRLGDVITIRRAIERKLHEGVTI